MIGAGTKLYRSNDGTVWEQIAKVLDLSPPSITRGSSEKTYLEDTNNAKSFEPGMLEPGECEFALEWDKGDAMQAKLKADLLTKSNFHYGIRFPDDSFDKFEGHITDWGKELPKEETIQRKVKIKLATLVDEGTWT